MLKYDHKTKQGKKMKQPIKTTLSIVLATALLTSVSFADENNLTEQPTQAQSAQLAPTPTPAPAPIPVQAVQAEPKKIEKIEIADGVNLDENFIKYLKNKTQINPDIELTRFVAKDKIKIIDEALGAEEWSKVVFEVVFKATGNEAPITATDVYFINEKSGLFTKELSNYKSKKEYLYDIKPLLTESIYKDTSMVLVAGNEDAKHKVVVFSDPLCPICRDTMPEMEKLATENPTEIAVYHYATPLMSYPDSTTLVRIAMAVKLKGGDYKKAIQAIGTVDNSNPHTPRQPDEVIKLVAEKMGVTDLGITTADLSTPEMEKIMLESTEVARSLEISGTPTVYVDGEFDKTRDAHLKFINPKQ